MQKTHDLIVDIGNSRVKYHYSDKTYSNLEELFVVLKSAFPAGTGLFTVLLISTVPEKTALIKMAIAEYMSLYGLKQIDFHEFDPLKQDSIKGLYAGIGADRVAKLLGAAKLFPQQNIILFDFGTALTMSILDADMNFLGGFIGLGFRTSLKSISAHCAQLDDYSATELPKIDLDFSEKISSPEQAIISGSYLGYLALIKEWKAYAERVLKDKKIITIATGGDAEFFSKYFDHSLPEIKILSMLA